MGNRIQDYNQIAPQNDYFKQKYQQQLQKSNLLEENLHKLQKENENLQDKNVINRYELESKIKELEEELNKQRLSLTRANNNFTNRSNLDELDANHLQTQLRPPAPNFEIVQQSALPTDNSRYNLSVVKRQSSINQQNQDQ